MIKTITAKEAKKILSDTFGDGTTFYAIDDKNQEIYEFDTKKERDIFVAKHKEVK